MDSTSPPEKLPFTPTPPPPFPSDEYLSGLRRPKIEITVAWKTLLKIAAALLFCYLLVQLRAVAAMLFAATLLATTLEPVLCWAVRRGWPRWVGVLLCAILVCSILGGFVAVLVPTVSTQGGALIEKLPTMRQDFVNQLPTSGGIRDTADRILGASSISDPGPILKRFVAWGAVAVEALTTFVVIIVIALYLVAEGEQVFQWLVAFLPKRHRSKAMSTAREVGVVVRRWITGQMISSVLAAIYSFTVLSILHVPSASLLALIAGVFDVIPVVGFFCSTIPAMASAVTVSPATALIVGVLYIFYHLLETYFIVPKVFGEQLRLSMIAVLISCLVAAYLAGPFAIIFVLPIVASYPVIERIWLQPHLAEDTLEKHEQLAESPEPKPRSK